MSSEKEPECDGHDLDCIETSPWEHHDISDDEGIVIGATKKDDEIDDWTDTASEDEDAGVDVKRTIRHDSLNKVDGKRIVQYSGHRNDDKDDNFDDSKDDSKLNEQNQIDEDFDNLESDESVTTYRRQGHGSLPSHHRRHGQPHHSGGHSRIQLAKVFMPTGREVRISVPEQLKGWKCGWKTKLINLNPHGKHGRREFKLVSKITEQTKRDHAGVHFRHYRFVKIQRIVNGCFWKRYRTMQTEIRAEAGYVNERMLFHGTNQVKDILKSGFDERYANINGMFGAGIYFAKHSSKSSQYAFGLNNPCPTHNYKNCDKCERQMLLCRVSMGKTKKMTGAAKLAHAPPGHHSVEGIPSRGGLIFPEYIVYRREQMASAINGGKPRLARLLDGIIIKPYEPIIARFARSSLGVIQTRLRGSWTFCVHNL